MGEESWELSILQQQSLKYPLHAMLLLCMCHLFFVFVVCFFFLFFCYILALLSGPCFRDHNVADSKQKQGFEGEKGTLLSVLKYVLVSRSLRRMYIARSNPRGR